MAFWLFRYLSSLGDNFGQLKPASVFRGSEPSEETLATLGQLGVKLIVNLEDGDQAPQRVAAESRHFLWQQVAIKDDEAPQVSQVKAALLLLDTKNVFVHCKGGRHRTGLVCAAYRVTRQGWKKQAAWEEAEDKYGFYGALGHGVLEDWFFKTDLSTLL